MSELLEIIMLLCFGASWPVNALKAYRSRTAKGQSPLFLCLIILGYLAGIAAKLTNGAYMAQLGEKWYVLFFYGLNLCMVAFSLGLYFRNRKLERQAAA